MWLGPIVYAGLVVSCAAAQTPPPAARAADTPRPAVAAQADYRFPTGAGLLFFYVKPDKTADFEAIVARLADVLDRTTDPTRKEQANSWRILKSVDVNPDWTIYVFSFVPAVAESDYDPVKVLGEAFPAEAQALYEKLRDAVIRVERMGLTKIR